VWDELSLLLLLRSFPSFLAVQEGKTTGLVGINDIPIPDISLVDGKNGTVSRTTAVISA
jgi:hypothetical protein